MQANAEPIATRSPALEWRRLGTWLAGVVCAAAAGIVYWRLYYGVDFTDESFHVAVPYRLVLGARPYVDEIDVTQQTTAILLYPFVWVYTRVAGLTGIVLFVRHLQFVLSLVAAACVFGPLRPLVGRTRAALIAPTLVLFVPFDIQDLNYDSLGTELFAAGCILGLPGPEPRRVTGWLAGSCLGLAAFAYPPLLPAVALAAAIRVAAAKRGARADAASAALPALGLPIAGLGVLFARAGLHTVLADYEHSSKYLKQAGGLEKLAGIAGHEWHTLPFRYALIAVLALIAAGWKRQRSFAGLLVASLPVLVLPPRPTFYAASLEYVAHLAWLAPVLLVLVHRRPGARSLFAAVWVPSLLAGGLTAYSSSNAGTNFAIGLLPGAIVSAVFLTWALEASGLRLTALVPLLAIDLLLGFFVTVPVYRDGRLSTLSARVDGGPYAGLFTSHRKLAFLDQLRTDVGRLPKRCRIVFLDDFPAGYLLTSATPDTNETWTAAVAPAALVSYRNALLRYYRHAGFPDVVVLMQRIPFAPPGSARLEHYHPTDPILQALRTHSFQLVANRFDYRVYASGAACA